ncbi:ubiquitin-conjugating enzyme E2 [Sporobolomyces koalae]|uniref:ubiquitin-conjugating enzyme E2 n=1 Tax=Sporobolomyces koalae TaxID=500713 RepID=UPI003174F85A
MSEADRIPATQDDSTDPAAAADLESPPASNPSPKACTTYNEDVLKVTNPDGSSFHAVVTRCWADEQNPDALIEAQRLGIDFVPLKPGWLEVLHPDGTRSEVLEASTELVDRGFLRGDMVRPARPRNTPPAATKPQAGTIIDISAQVKLERVLAPQDRLEPWYDTKDFVAANRINRGDHVVFGEWIGLVEEVFQVAIIEFENGTLKRVCDGLGSNLSVGPASEAVQELLAKNFETMWSGFFATNTVKNILDVKQMLVVVNWLCKNQLSEKATSTQDSDWVRPKRFWPDLDNLKLVRATADHLRTIHDKLVPKISSSVPPAATSRHLSTFPHSFEIFNVVNCRSTLKILWQDGTITSGPSNEFEQVHTLDDETDVFPGEVGMFTGVTPARCGVVQSMDRRKRTIKLKFLNSTTTTSDEEDEIISGLEFDPHGPPPDNFGVRRGDWVLIAKDKEGNGAVLPTVPGLGESETAAGLMPNGDQLRLMLSAVGLPYAETISDSFRPPRPQTSPDQLADIDWYGEVWDLQLDGQALIRFPGGTKRPIELRRLIHLDDGMDPQGEMMDAAQAALDEHHHHHHHHHHDHEHCDHDMSDGEEEGASDGWMTETDDEDLAVESAGLRDQDMVEADVNGEGAGAASRKRKRSRRESKGWADDDDDEEGSGDSKRATSMAVDDAEDKQKPVQVEAAVPAASEPAVPAKATEASSTKQESTVSMPGELEDHADWTRFEVLEEAPADHHYANEAIQVPSKSFMSRVRKEHGVLATSLPPNILVRAYESRLDLLRCLIIGPVGTPFQNAPFLFDLFLSPTKFPQEPPQVFFHSWAGGTRVSPNLYSEGKVCLSLLGTWSGDKTESWSSARSSILQILISIQGLIMVEDPYFTEPGFEKQMGTPEGTAASELYNERTLVLTRNFVKRACEYPPANFGREIAAYYYTGLPSNPPTPGALGGIVEQCRALLEESEKWLAASKLEPTEDRNDAQARPPPSVIVPSQRVLTEGAGLSLKRTLKALEELQERGPKV